MMGNQSNSSSPHLSKTKHFHGQNHHLEQMPSHHEIIPSSLLMVVIPVIIVILLLAIILLVVMLRRMRFSSKPTTINNNNIAASIIKSGNCMFVAQSTLINTNSPSPAAGEGINYGRSCLYGGGNVERRAIGTKAQIQEFTLKEAEMATNGFSQGNLIGNGTYSVVYRGVLRDGNAVAIKLLHRHGRHAERAFRFQVDLLSRLRCPYITELLGYCVDQHERLLVFEYMPNGSLHKLLHDVRRPNSTTPQGEASLNWGNRLRIALDCARALEYLHEHTTPSVIHRNFKCTNILLDQNFRAKLSGFGLAKFGSDKLNGLISTRVLGTTGYLAPEYASTGKLTTKSDVYSYGIILLELLTGRVPIDTTRPPGEHVLVSWISISILALPRLTNRDKVMEMIDPTLKGQYTSKDLIQVAAIAAMCVQAEPDYRPLMTDVVQSLIPLIKNLSTDSQRFKPRASPTS